MGSIDFIIGKSATKSQISEELEKFDNTTAFNISFDLSLPKYGLTLLNSSNFWLTFLHIPSTWLLNTKVLSMVTLSFFACSLDGINCPLVLGHSTFFLLSFSFKF